MLNPLKRQGPIKSGALNLTLGSGVIAALVALGDAIPGVYSQVLGPTPSNAVRASVFIAAVAAWGLIAVADILARGYVHARDQPQIALVPHGLGVGRQDLPAVDERGWTVSALRMKPGDPDACEYFVTKAGKDPAWLTADKLEFT